MGRKRQQLATNWTSNQRRLMEWFATPSLMRTPPTEGELADKMGVNRITLWKWKQIPGFMEEVQQLITVNLGDVYNDVMHSFKRAAVRGSFPHQRMYFEMLGVYSSRSNVNLNTRMSYEIDLSALSDDEIVTEVHKILNVKQLKEE